MLFDEKNQELQIDSSIFKITESDARLFDAGNDHYILTEFDISAVANNYDISIIEAYEKILESHNLSPDQVSILCELTFSTSAQVRAKMEEIRAEMARAKIRKDDIRVRSCQNLLSNYQRQLDEMVRKEREEKLREREREERSA